MSSLTELREKVERARQSQPESELKRKAVKAKRRGAEWTQEAIDYATAKGRRIARRLRALESQEQAGG